LSVSDLKSSQHTILLLEAIAKGFQFFPMDEVEKIVVLKVGFNSFFFFSEF